MGMTAFRQLSCFKVSLAQVGDLNQLDRGDMGQHRAGLDAYGMNPPLLHETTIDVEVGLIQQP